MPASERLAAGDAIASTLPHLEDLLNMLRDLDADKLPHSGRTLIEHLVGTYALLKSWDCDEDIAIAGLFCSIYDKNIFWQGALSVDHRDGLRELIGGRAEQLAYLFCSIERTDGILPALRTRKLIDRFNHTPIDVDTATLRDLVTLECASQIEQRGDKKFLSTLMTRPGINWLGLPAKLKTAVNQYAQAAAYSAAAGQSAPVADSQASAYVLRQAQEGDAVRLATLVRELKDNHRQLTRSGKWRTATQIREWLVDPRGVIIVVQKGADIVGFAAARVESLVSLGSRVARVRFIYVQPHHRGRATLRLLQSLFVWARRKNAAELRIDEQPGARMKRNVALLRRLG
ncbi:MAG TPA: GNAT family N-acetyltransferase [Rhodocyclaceae bacterium]|nr:GNAT family N-acetyltransferase [Rhodocyclaceae bacterium]